MMMHYKTCLVLLTVGLLVGVGYADNVTATQDNLNNDMSYQAWGPGTFVSKADAGDSVLFTVQLGSTGDGKFVWADWSGSIADWSGYDGFALKFTLMSSTGTGTVDITNFLGDSSWKFFQPKGLWPVLGVGDEAIAYVDFDESWDDAGVTYDLTDSQLNKINGYGWQVITNDASMLGEQVSILVTPTTVPEPVSLSLLAMGGLALAARRRNR